MRDKLIKHISILKSRHIAVSKLYNLNEGNLSRRIELWERKSEILRQISELNEIIKS